MALSETLKRFIDDFESPRLLGQLQQDPKPRLPLVATNTPEPILSEKYQSFRPSQPSSEHSTSPSTSPRSSILSRRESESSNMSTAPSDRAYSLVGDTGTMSSRGRSGRHLPCILNGMIVCPFNFPLSERVEWISHSLSHYGGKSPPHHAICVFCPQVFDSPDAVSCWRARMNHIADHFENGWTMEMIRPDFRVLDDMGEKGGIPKDTVKHCFQHSERPRCDTLHPHDFIPEEIKKKEEAAHKQSNDILVPESRHEIRARRHGKKPVVGSKKPKAKAKVVDGPMDGSIALR